MSKLLSGHNHHCPCIPTHEDNFNFFLKMTSFNQLSLVCGIELAEITLKLACKSWYLQILLLLEMSFFLSAATSVLGLDIQLGSLIGVCSHKGVLWLACCHSLICWGSMLDVSVWHHICPPRQSRWFDCWSKIHSTVHGQEHKGLVDRLQSRCNLSLGLIR